jgi:ribose transport system permease protein
MTQIDLNLIKKARRPRISVQVLGMLVALVFLCIVLSILSPVFLTFDNLMNIIRQISIVAIIAVGSFLIVIVGGMDISVGSVAALTGVVTGLFTIKFDLGLAVGILMGILTGIVVGLINGILINKVKLPSFIVTLATMTITKGVCFVISGGIPISGFPEGFAFIGRGYLGPIPWPVIFVAVIYIVMHDIMKRTRFGVYCYAIGGNREAARLSGIKIGRIEIVLYVLGGMFASFGGVILASRLNSGSPNVGNNFMFEAFTAIILGGTNLSGGEGELIGVLIGSMFIGVLSNGMSLLNLDAYFQMVVQGIVLIIAVVLQAYLNSRRS